jgi:hypothetical protein
VRSATSDAGRPARDLEICGTAGFIPAAELRELGERLDREIMVTVWFMICRDRSPLTAPRVADYGE